MQAGGGPGRSFSSSSLGALGHPPHLALATCQARPALSPCSFRRGSGAMSPSNTLRLTTLALVAFGDEVLTPA